MISITASKIAGLAPVWAGFPGFSLLFDAPGSAYVAEDGIEWLRCDLAGDPSLSFYNHVHQGLRALEPDRLLLEFGFCALPSASYHMTAFDVANVGDLERCREEVRPELEKSFSLLPSAAAFDVHFLTLAEESELHVTDWDLTFTYGGLTIWGGVLAAVLLPEDQAALERFGEARSVLSRAYQEQYGVGAGEFYVPHLSLAYFLNKEGAQAASDQVSAWDAVVRESVGEQALTFAGVSQHGFTDMATFFRLGE